MNANNGLGRWFGSPPRSGRRKSRPRTRRTLLQVEHLETRCVPTLFTSLGSLTGGGAAGTGSDPNGVLVEDAGGNLYGTAEGGGSNNDGTVFEVPYLGGNTYGPITALASFNGANGIMPLGGLVEDASGDLFGVTATGAIATHPSGGTIFVIPAHTNTISTLAVFNGNNGQDPVCSLIMDASGNLFGTTVSGGSLNEGTVFELPHFSSTIITLATFHGPDGANPYGGVVMDSSGNLYGTTAAGGPFNDGTVYELPFSGGMYGPLTILAAFNGTNGSTPTQYARPMLDSQGNLWGTASMGGGGPNVGTVWELPKGLGTLASFPFTSSTNGAIPEAGVVEDVNTNVFGTCPTGGTGGLNNGTVFELGSAGTGSFTAVVSLTGTSGPYPGSAPQSTLIQDSMGDLFGSTTTGGSANDGTVFELIPTCSPIVTVPPSGTSGQPNYNFTILATDVIGSATFSLASGTALPPGLTLTAAGLISGTPTTSGTFHVPVNVTDSDGNTGTATYTFVFNSPVTITTSTLPNWTVEVPGYAQQINGTGGTGTLTFSTTAGLLPPGLSLSSSGLLSGTPASTGTYNFTVTATDTVGASASQSYTVVINPPLSLGISTLLTFTGPNGANPDGDLLKLNGNFFGTTSSGGMTSTGSPASGTAFELNESTGMLATLATFDGPNGADPGGGLVADTASNLYGTTVAGGMYGYGTIYKIPFNPTTGMYGAPVTCASFNGTTDGGNPYGTLVLDSSGIPIGTTSSGGANGMGTVFTLTQTTAGVWKVVTLASFDGTHGATPLAGVTMINHSLYGTASQGGKYGDGTAFVVPWAISGGSGGYGPLTTIADFNETNGAYPQAGLTADSSGDLFGTTFAGGMYDDGTTFEIPSGSGMVLDLASFNAAAGPAFPIGGVTMDGNGNLFGTVPQCAGPTKPCAGGTYEIQNQAAPGVPPSYAAGTLPIFQGMFNGPNGASPSAGVIEECNGNLVGTTLFGGASDLGTIFKEVNTLPVAIVGKPYKASFDASGGTGTLTFSAPWGTTPSGLALSPSGMLTGTPTGSGTFVITIQVTDADGALDTHLYKLPILPPLSITTTTLPEAEVGCPYNQTIQTTGGIAPLTFQVTSGALPPGLSLNTSSGSVAGTPNASGSYTFTITVTDAVGDSASLTYTLVVAKIITLDSFFANLTEYVPFSFQANLLVSNGIAPFQFSEPFGMLPKGLTLNSNTGVISGAPQVTSANFVIELQVTDAAGCIAGDLDTLVISPPLVLSPQVFPNALAGVAYSQALPFAGGTGPFTFSVPPSTAPLPFGLSVNSNGVLSFEPTLAGTYSFTVDATDSVGATASQSYTLTVNPGTPLKASFVTQPVSTPTGVVLPPVSVQVYDAFGNPVTTDSTDSVTMTVASGPALHPPNPAFLAGSTTTATLNMGAATFSNLTLVAPGSYILSAWLPTLGIFVDSAPFSVLPLQVLPASFAGSPSGFSLQFNAPYLVNSLTPVLYGTGFGASAPPPSVIVTTDPGHLSDTAAYVEGSLVLSPATNSITFVATSTAYETNTGAPELPDGTYTVIVRSSAPTNGFQALNPGGGFLDGLYTDVPGSGDYENTFSVNTAASHQDVLWIPPTADGPGQPLEPPGNNQAGGGYPVYLDSSGGVSSVQVTLNYNPAVLTVTGVTGANFSLLASSTPGHAALLYSGPALAAGTQTPIGFVTAMVPSGTTASPVPYKLKDLLHLSGASLNGGALSVATDDALHLVAFVGDADGNGTYTSNDAVLITRVALQTDDGFVAYALVDPVIVADTDGNGFIPADAALEVNEASVGFPTSTLPSPPIPPNVHFQAIANNVDPTLSIPSELSVAADGTVCVAVNLDDADPAGSSGLLRGHLALTYDPRQFAVSAADVHPGTLLDPGSGWSVVPTIDPTTGEIVVTLSSDTPISSSIGGSLVIIDFHLASGAAVRLANPVYVALVSSVTIHGQAIASELEDAAGTFTLSAGANTDGRVTFAAFRGLDPLSDHAALVTAAAPTLQTPVAESKGVAQDGVEALPSSECQHLELSSSSETDAVAQKVDALCFNPLAVLLPSMVLPNSALPGTTTIASLFGLAGGQQRADQLFQALTLWTINDLADNVPLLPPATADTSADSTALDLLFARTGDDPATPYELD